MGKIYVNTVLATIYSNCIQADTNNIQSMRDTISSVGKLAYESWVKNNSKIKMPKVFDDWAKQFDTGTTEGLDEALSRIFDIYMTGSFKTFYDVNLNQWLRNGTDEELYAKCIDALVNGYEVE